LYRQAKLYGFRAVSGDREFARAASGSLEEFEAVLQSYGKDEVPALFCAANAWANWISSSLDSVEAVADLAMLEATMKRTLELDDTYFYGSPHLLMGVYLSAKPTSLGGDPAKAKAHLTELFKLGADRLLAAKVLYAKYYARSINDRELFVQTLEEVIATPLEMESELTFANAVAKKKPAICWIRRRITLQRYHKRQEERKGASYVSLLFLLISIFMPQSGWTRPRT
jgi:hypothetical protein